MVSITKDNLTLKQFDLLQAELLFRIIDSNRKYFKTWFSWVDKTNKLEDIEIFLKNENEKYSKGEGIYLGIWFKNTLSGVVSFNYINKNNNCATIGYWLAEEFQGKGIMTKACKMLIEYGFNTLNLHKIDISHASENIKSANVIKKIGFTHEGHFRKSELVNGIYLDQEYYGLLKEEWKNE